MRQDGNARDAVGGEGFERRQCAVLDPERFHGGEFGLIRNAAFDRGAQRLGGDRGARRAIVGARRPARDVRKIFGKRLHRAFDRRKAVHCTFDRRNAVRQRIEIGALDARLLRGALGRLDRRGGGIGACQRVARGRGNAVNAAIEGGERIAERFRFRFCRGDPARQRRVGPLRGGVACCDASAASILSSRAESSLLAAGCDGSPTRGGTVSPRGGSTPDAHSPATIASIVSAPAAAAMPYAARAPRFSEPALSAKSQRARRPAALSSSVRSSAAPVAPASAVEAGFSASTSVAVRSMVGGRRRDVLSGSLVMRSPAGPTVRSAGPACRHGIVRGQAWRQQTGLPPVQSVDRRASKAASLGRSARHGHRRRRGPQRLRDLRRQTIVHRLPQRGFEQAGVRAAVEKASALRREKCSTPSMSPVSAAAAAGGKRSRRHDAIDLRRSRRQSLSRAARRRDRRRAPRRQDRGGAPAA